MLEFKSYFYYSKNDSKKEPIDRIIASDEESALMYFTERKQINEFTFKQLYNIEVHAETESK